MRRSIKRDVVVHVGEAARRRRRLGGALCGRRVSRGRPGRLLTASALLARRLTLAGEIGRVKAAQGLPVLDETREAAVLASRGDLLPQRRAQVERLFRLLMAESREEQERHG